MERASLVKATIAYRGRSVERESEQAGRKATDVDDRTGGRPFSSG